jgi:hypothetical protein
MEEGAFNDGMQGRLWEIRCRKMTVFVINLDEHEKWWYKDVWEKVMEGCVESALSGKRETRRWAELGVCALAWLGKSPSIDLPPQAAVAIVHRPHFFTRGDASIIKLVAQHASPSMLALFAEPSLQAIV